MNWEKYNNEQLAIGDVIEISSKIVNTEIVTPFIKHFGIVLSVDNELRIAHNPYGERPEIITINKFLGARKIERIFHTNKTNEQILTRYDECKNTDYKFFIFNCEDFVSCVCDCYIGQDQRKWYFGVGITLVVVGAVIGVLVYLITKTKT